MIVNAIENQWPLDCLFNRLLKLSTKETSNLCTAGFLWGKSTHNLLVSRTSKAESISKTSQWWCKNASVILVTFVLVNPWRPRQNVRYFADDIFKCIFLNENVWISLKISLNFVPKVWINNIPALVQIMAWRRPGGKPLYEPIMVSLLTHICVTRPQWVNGVQHFSVASFY